MPWNIWPTIDCMLIGVKRAGDQHAGHQREGDRHAHVAEAQEQDRHQEQDRGRCSFHDARAKSSASSGPSKPCCQPLTSCSTENSTISAPGDRHDRRVGRERDQRRHAEAAEIEQRVLGAEHQTIASADQPG